MCFKDEHSAYSDAVTAKLSQGQEAYVPPLWSLEVLNALLIAERRECISGDEFAQLLQIIEAFPVEAAQPAMPGACGLELNLARQHGLSIYDAAYLALALCRYLPLATIDVKLRKAAQGSGIELFR